MVGEYESSTGRLELGDWRPVAGGRVDWDVWRDDGPCSVAEVRHRLAAVGEAMFAFVELHGAIQSIRDHRSRLDPQHMRGTIGTGGRLLRLSTGNGRLEIRKGS